MINWVGMNDYIVARVDRARLLLAECRDAPAAKKIVDIAHAAEIYARRQRLGNEAIHYAHGVKVDAMTMLGDFLEAHPKANGGDAQRTRFRKGTESPKTLEDIGITKKESSISQRLAKLAKTNPERHAAIRAAIDPIQSVFSAAHVSYNSGNNEWYTPKEYIEAAREVMGRIDLDPASTREANAVIKADNFYSSKEDGLQHEWHGKVWMNPPYASELIGQFTEKLAKSFDNGAIKEAVVLVNNATETNWFQCLAIRASAICFPKGRVKFWSPNKENAAPLQGQAVIYLGKKPATFSTGFQRFGLVLCKP